MAEADAMVIGPDDNTLSRRHRARWIVTDRGGPRMRLTAPSTNYGEAPSPITGEGTWRTNANRSYGMVYWRSTPTYSRPGRVSVNQLPGLMLQTPPVTDAAEVVLAAVGSLYHWSPPLVSLLTR